MPAGWSPETRVEVGSKAGARATHSTIGCGCRKIRRTTGAVRTFRGCAGASCTIGSIATLASGEVRLDQPRRANRPVAELRAHARQRPGWPP